MILKSATYTERKRKIFTLLLQNEEEFRGFLMYVGAIEKDDAMIGVTEFILSEYKNHICAHADIPTLAAKMKADSLAKDHQP